MTPCRFSRDFLIHLVATEQFGVVAEVAKKPIEFPKRSVGAVQPSREGARSDGFWLQDDESQL